MCGISGFIDPKLSVEEANVVILDMLKSISHRGPDSSKTFISSPLAFGHNRLSIIDLSADGDQPMSYYDCTIVFNGEIYNYIEVRNELKALGYNFVTQSDTEVILAAYNKWGKKCVEKFVGMWAFALWDNKLNELFCSRDRFGIKPFYYLLKDGRFYFGSEYKALKKSPIFSSELNLDQISRGLQLGWVCYADETYYSELHSLPAACNMVFKNGNVVTEKYWEIDVTKKFVGSEEEKKATFKSLFMDSIMLHMRADVEVGGCLSGGLDSSSIAASVSKLFPEQQFKTFTIYYEGKGEVDERPWVNEVLKQNKNLVDFSYSPSQSEIPEGFENTLYHADVPITGSSPVSQYFVMKLAGKQKIKVILDGQGADEYLAGYMHSFYRLTGGLFKKLKFGSMLFEFNKHVGMQKFSLKKKVDVFAKSVYSGFQSEDALYQMEYKNYYPFLSNRSERNFSLEKQNGSNLNNFLYHLLFNTSLPSLLHFEDRNSMAFSIESRVPFLDHRLVEFVFSLDDDDKLSSGITKKILRNSMEGILPDAIKNRTDKKGFVTPGEVKWLKGPLNYLIKEYEHGNSDFLNKNKVASALNSFNNGDVSKANLIWRVVVLNRWLKKN